MFSLLTSKFLDPALKIGSVAEKQSKEKMGMAALQQPWNPRLIIYQIVALQCGYYLALGALFAVAHVLFGTYISLDHIFTAKYMNPESAHGWIGIAATVLAAFAGALMMPIIVEKSRKCLDFGSTIYIFHLLFCTFFRACPTTWGWWITNTVGLVSMVVIGEYLCSRVEMRDIPLVSL
jgi:hypothetical protein